MLLPFEPVTATNGLLASRANNSISDTISSFFLRAFSREQPFCRYFLVMLLESLLLAALLGPLCDDLLGKRVVLVMCGSNIDWRTFEEQAIFDDPIA